MQQIQDWQTNNMRTTKPQTFPSLNQLSNHESGPFTGTPGKQMPEIETSSSQQLLITAQSIVNKHLWKDGWLKHLTVSLRLSFGGVKSWMGATRQEETLNFEENFYYKRWTKYR